MTAYQSAGKGCADHHHDRQGQRTEACMKGGQTAHLLQVQGVEEQKAGERGEGEDCKQRGAAERHAMKEAEVDQRFLAPRLIQQEASKSGAGKREQANDE